ncbi:hypothetical protein Taro_053178 [Colocasia esculenta]|uniref:Uncharacterized protein n=1 Tax=Colocasia esculenta TaxID=4460 RepID=A0A843XLU6_COLES|nr:hypothetical protein [Colocasia esculenta]
MNPRDPLRFGGTKIPAQKAINHTYPCVPVFQIWKNIRGVSTPHKHVSTHNALASNWVSGRDSECRHTGRLCRHHCLLTSELASGRDTKLVDKVTRHDLEGIVSLTNQQHFLAFNLWPSTAEDLHKILEAITTVRCCEDFSMQRFGLLGDFVLIFVIYDFSKNEGKPQVLHLDCHFLPPSICHDYFYDGPRRSSPLTQ